ncbi:putative fusarubin cluster-esterase [Cladorrhinum samala]|uniref:Fusarubin cluster-esterase n=1 Tax=Cladorrhinum samala TaxID=585594 RepID=A0AAV9HJW4_9PEZI|nr:putative fusarubin cluster-esterase [Cladorrhinum samala]
MLTNLSLSRALTVLVGLLLVVSGPVQAQDVPHLRTYFYVGGSYIVDGSGEHYLRQQMYVEKLVPSAGVTQPYPIVFIHGWLQSATNFLDKPDGGRGWASLFLKQGYEVYLADQPMRGRSPWRENDGVVLTLSAESTMRYFTAISSHNLWPQAALHTQWPGNGSTGDAVFEAFYSSQIQSIANTTAQQLAGQIAVAQLLDRIGKPAVLLGHSQGGPIPLLAADVRPDLVKAIILIEPAGPPFQEITFEDPDARPWGVTHAPITYDPPITSDPRVELLRESFPAEGSKDRLGCILQATNDTSRPPRELVNLVDKPILLVTGEASYAAGYDYCTVKYLQQAGCSLASHLELAGVGIHGNGHMMFLEMNSDIIQAVIAEWTLAVRSDEAEDNGIIAS